MNPERSRWPIIRAHDQLNEVAAVGRSKPLPVVADDEVVRERDVKVPASSQLDLILWLPVVAHGLIGCVPPYWEQRSDVNGSARARENHDSTLSGIRCAWPSQEGTPHRDRCGAGRILLIPINEHPCTVRGAPTWRVSHQHANERLAASLYAAVDPILVPLDRQPRPPAERQERHEEGRGCGQDRRNGGKKGVRRIHRVARGNLRGAGNVRHLAGEPIGTSAPHGAPHTHPSYSGFERSPAVSGTGAREGESPC